MNRQREIEAFDFVQNQIKNGYINLTFYDVAEIEMVERAIEEYRDNHELGDHANTWNDKQVWEVIRTLSDCNRRN